MAQRTSVTFVDDVDGSEADRTIAFAVDGVSYEIDLSADNSAAFWSLLEPWVQSARRTGGRKAGAFAAMVSTGGAPVRDGSAVRQWARQNGYVVGERGRISPEIREAYETSLVPPPEEEEAEPRKRAVAKPRVKVAL